MTKALIFFAFINWNGKGKYYQFEIYSYGANKDTQNRLLLGQTSKNNKHVKKKIRIRCLSKEKN